MNTALKWFLITVGVVIVAGVIFYVSSETAETPGPSHTVPVNTESAETNTNSIASTNESTSDEQGNDDSSPAAGSTVRISAIASGFVPQEVTIKVGDSVTWKNDSADIVYVAPNDHPSHVAYPGVWEDDGSGEIEPGEEYSHTFTTAGTYGYHNHENEDQIGTIIVE